jgi:hypothetical protein
MTQGVNNMAKYSIRARTYFTRDQECDIPIEAFGVILKNLEDRLQQLDGAQATPTGGAADPLASVFARAKELDRRLTKLQGQKGGGAASTGGQTQGLPVGGEGGAQPDPSLSAPPGPYPVVGFKKFEEAKAAGHPEAQDSALGAVTGAVGGLMTGGPLGAVVGGLAGGEEKDTQDSISLPDLYTARPIDAETVPSYSTHLQTKDAARSQLARPHILNAPKSVVDDEAKRIQAKPLEVEYNESRLSGKELLKELATNCVPRSQHWRRLQCLFTQSKRKTIERRLPSRLKS